MQEMSLLSDTMESSGLVVHHEELIYLSNHLHKTQTETVSCWKYISDPGALCASRFEINLIVL